MAGTFQSDMFSGTAKIRQPSSSASPGADVTYASATEVSGNWEQVTKMVPGPGGGWQKSVDHVFITSVVITYDDLVFRPGVDASDENNGHRPKLIEELPDPDGPSGTVHHYEVTV